MPVETFLAPIWEPKPLNFGDGSHLNNMKQAIQANRIEKSTAKALSGDATDEDRNTHMAKLLALDPNAYEAVLFTMNQRDAEVTAQRKAQMEGYGKIAAVLSNLDGETQMTAIKRELVKAQDSGDEVVAQELQDLIGMPPDLRDMELRTDALATQMGAKILQDFTSQQKFSSEQELKRDELAVKQGELGVKRGQLEVAQQNAASTQERVRLERKELEAELKAGPGKGKVTDTQRAARGFSVRMVKASKIIDRLEDTGFNPASTGQSLASITNLTATKEYQKYTQAAKDWMRAKLRKESGAVISEEEIENEWDTYFPVFGDSDEVIEQKQQARLNAEQQMAIGSGALADEPIAASRPQPTREQAAAELARRRSATPRG